MGMKLQDLAPELLPQAVKYILNAGYSRQKMERLLMTLCDCLTCAPFRPNLGMLVLHFMESLEREPHYDILFEVTMTYVECFFKLLILPKSRKIIGPIARYMLTKIRNSPDAFHKVKNLLNCLWNENTNSSLMYLQDMVNMCVALMDFFPGFPQLYEGLRWSLELYKPEINYKQALDCSTSPFCSTGKVGLNNLGNTCT